MSSIMFFNSNRPDIGLYTRQTTLGEEYALVKQFVEYYCHLFTHNNKKTRLAVFIEPRIEAGFPDVVFATYLPSITDNWSDRREALDKHDLKLLSFLSNATDVLGAKMITKLGFSEKQVITSLEKLMDAKLVIYRNRSWRVRRLRDYFSLTKLIAVEAKLNDIKRVFEQTHLNTRFASHSYALTNSANPHRDTVRAFFKYGIGLYCKDSHFRKVVEARQFTLPSSYLSFQFNEWIGKAIAIHGGASNA